MERYKNEYRWGGAVDRGRLEALANSLKLDCQGNLFVNCDANSIREEVLQAAGTGIRMDDECFVCFVNAHGGTAEDGAFFFTDCDGNRISLSTDIVEPFRKCKHLLGKPKIFFVNTWLGTPKLRSMDDIGNGPGAGEEEPIPSLWSKGTEVRHLEQDADTLIVFSTVRPAASLREKGSHGTNFVYALMRAVNRNRDSRDLLSILTLMTYDILDMEPEAKDAASGKVTTLRQCPVIISSLRKSVYWRSV